MSERLDRIEALVESNAKSIEALATLTSKSIEDLANSINELKKRTDSNAKSIEALTHQINQDREEDKKYREIQRKDRAHVFEWMARLAAAQADYYEAQADYLRHVEQIDDRLTEILSRTTPANS